jgi:predicted RNA-binding protein
MPSYWIVAVGEANFRHIIEHGVYGCGGRMCNRMINKVRPGDVLIVYVNKKGCSKYCGVFAAALEVVSDWFDAEKPQFPDEVAEGTLKYVKLVRVRAIAIGSVKPEEIANELEILRGRKKLWVSLYYYAMKPIPQKDAQTIINKLKSQG